MPEEGESYEGGRDFNALKKFVKAESKKPCDPASPENCNKKEKAYIDTIKDFDSEKMSSEHKTFNDALTEARAKHKELDAQFEKLKDEAMAVQKEADEAKKAASKLQDKTGYKIQVLAAKLAPKEAAKEAEL